MPSGTSVAYDYQRFEESGHTGIQALAKAKKPKNKKSVAKVVCYMFIVAAMLSAVIYTRVVQAELNSEYVETLEMVNQVKNENARLQIELEKRLSLGNLEETARGLNMGELQQHQVEYVQFDSKNKVEVIENPGFFKKISNWFGNLF